MPVPKGNRPWMIYALKDPRTAEIRYVGWTVDPKKRLRGHVSYAKHKRENTHKSHWIESLLAVGLEPEMITLETGRGSWEEAERKWIAHFRDAGVRLTNLTDGGDGAPGVEVKPETRAKLSEIMRKRIFTEEHRARISEAKRGKMSEAHKAHLDELHAKLAGRPRSAAANQKTADKLRGRKRPPEVVQKVAARLRGRKLSDAMRKKLSEAHKGKSTGPLSESRRKAISEARKGMKFSPQHRANIASASRAGAAHRRYGSGVGQMGLFE